MLLNFYLTLVYFFCVVIKKQKMKTLSTVIAIVLLQIATSFAGNDNNPKVNNTQTTAISGKVVDFNNQEGLAGVAVKIAGTDKVVFTDFDGNFFIDNIPANAKVKLQVNYISYNAVVIDNLKLSSSSNAVKVSLSKAN